MTTRTTYWSPAPEIREQMILFTQRLDDALPPDHGVRLFDSILDKIDWSPFEAEYHGRLGQPPIHPRVLAGVILYGMTKRIFSSRGLEEALLVRMDFRWLAEGRSIDHTTLSKFRKAHPEALRKVFIQLVQIGRDLNFVPLNSVAFDGTRMRSNNRRSGTRTKEELLKEREELGRQFDELQAQANADDARDQERFGSHSSHAMPQEMLDVQERMKKVDEVLKEFERIEQSGEKPPKRLPVTDPESRLAPNKEGGFAPNHTPTAMVDVESGLVIECDVIRGINEDQHLVPSILRVQEDFGLEKPPAEALADGLMATGENLSACEELGIDLYSPIRMPDPAANPALRDDPTQPVPQEKWSELPLNTGKRNGEKFQQIDKSAFIYDEEKDCYWCPNGQQLNYSNTTHEKDGQRQRTRDRYVADPQICADCPLKALCVQGQAKQRQINREQHEAPRERHARKMATPEAKEKYARRRHPGERPFATIKQQFGARRFLLRGLEKVRIEWRWMTMAFNLTRLTSLIRSRAGPGEGQVASTPVAG